MARHLIHIADWLHRVTHVLCQGAFVVMFGAVLATVVLRYGFSSGFIWLQDLGIYAFGLFAVLSLPCAMQADLHVRVDVLRSGQSTAERWRYDLVAVAGFAFPCFLLLLWYSLPQALSSMGVLEASPQIGGLPFYFLVKAAIPLASALMLVQAMAFLARSRLQKNTANVD